MDVPLYTVFAGALLRYKDGWRWRDGHPEPRVRDMLLRDVAPAFRFARYGTRICVEIPAAWRDARYWPENRVDPRAAAIIEALLRGHGERMAISGDGLEALLGKQPQKIDGWIVALARWEATMSALCGASWDKRDEGAILARACALGWIG